ncbi:MAG: hypothetical protein LBE34_13805 [Flavobacteriaceae bacterium]|jgi:hypothetical protein|nr:hypothetical protein [Flavobacteriaceae bacterium]
MEVVIGLYGCYCHSFKDWDEHNYFSKQKVTIGSIVKVRCSGLFAIVESSKNGGGYVDINILPCKFPRDKTYEHVSNLIQSKDFTVYDKEQFNRLKNKRLNQLSII